MVNFLKKNRQKINEDLKYAKARSYFSPTLLSLYRAIAPTIEVYVKGKVLDVGCGDMPYKDLIFKKTDQYDTLDVEARTNGVKFIGSIENMSMVEDGSYDCSICFEVLEHVPNPFQAVHEIHRILKRGGLLMLSVPHLSRLHEEPHDYYRYTHYGMRHILETNGFEVLEIKRTGALFSFLGHQISSFVLCLLWHIPILKWVSFFLNKWLLVLPCYYLDKVLFRNSVLPLGFLCVARKND